MSWTAVFGFRAASAPAIDAIYLAMVDPSTGEIDATIRNYQSGANGVTITSNATGEYTVEFVGMPAGTPPAGAKLIAYTGTITANAVTGWLASALFYPIDESQALMNLSASGLQSNAQLGAAAAIAAAGLTGLTGSGVTLTFHDGNGAIVPNIIFSVTGTTQGGKSSSLGVASFGLPDGSYTVIALPADGIIFAPYTLVVSGTTTATITGSTPAALPSPGSGQTTCYVYTKDATGTLQTGVPVYYTIIAAPAGESGNTYSKTPRLVTSNGSAQAAIALPIGATFTVQAGTGVAGQFAVGSKPMSFIVPANGPYAAGDVIGNY